MTKLALITLVAFTACKKSDIPPRPINGAPVAFVAKSITPGPEGSLDVKVYNFSDKRVAGYAIVMRFHDASGAVLKVPFGVDDFKDVGFSSFTGQAFLCQPQSWCSFTLDHVDVPAKAASVEILATRVGALADDTHFMDKPLFDHDTMEWPAQTSAQR